jgi:hypothetical protein
MRLEDAIYATPYMRAKQRMCLVSNEDASGRRYLSNPVHTSEADDVLGKQ